MFVFRSAVSLLTLEERRRGTVLLFLTTVMALVEMVGVASVVPFLAVLGDPNIISDNEILSRMYAAVASIGISSQDHFIYFLGGASFLIIVISAVVRIGTHYKLNSFVEYVRMGLSSRLLASYLSQPYKFFLSRHSGELSKAILAEISTAIGHVYQPGISFVAHGMVLFFLTCFLLYVNPSIAIVAAAFMGGLYSVIFISIRGRLSSLGQQVVRANEGRFLAASEAFGGIQHIKLMGLENSYTSKFRVSAARYGASEAASRTLYQIPSFLIEAIVFGMMLILTLTLMVGRDGDDLGLGEMLPVLGVYAMASLRMKPAMQAIYQGFASFRYGSAALAILEKDLSISLPPVIEAELVGRPRMKVTKQIKLVDIGFTYPGADGPALEDINIDIPVGASIGIVGATGSGKTTLLDIILGLLEPAHGSVVVDGNSIDKNKIRRWQNALGYVPQDVYLTDASVAENIALGEREDEINHSKVTECAKLAQLHDFIVHNLPAGYASSVGERGVRLSGGQKQRIGIARAMYHEPDVIVFDEATSALDSLTEKALVDALDEISKSKTIIAVAHRLSTVKHCDRIFVLGEGKIISSGTYQQLIKRSEVFKGLAGIGFDE